jgi:hypothetical protein
MTLIVRIPDPVRRLFERFMPFLPSSLHSRPSKRVKVKELSYQAVFGKGGGLVRVYTGLVSPLQYRVVVVCSRKSNVGDVVSTALAKCGKHEHDAKK